MAAAGGPEDLLRAHWIEPTVTTYAEVSTHHIMHVHSILFRLRSLAPLAVCACHEKHVDDPHFGDQVIAHVFFVANVFGCGALLGVVTSAKLW